MSTREERTMKFRQETERNILKCADWLKENADDLAYRFAGGCQGWSIEFRSDATDGMGVVVINVKNSRSDLVTFDALADDSKPF